MNTVKRGFTLTELLVVIAIIAILAAILFPVSAKVREKARQTSCASNMKQIGLSLIQYQQDYDEKFPAGAPNVNNNSVLRAGVGWVGEIYSYAKSTGMFRCPDDSTASSGVAVPVSYAMNTYVAGQAVAQLGEPTTTVMGSEVSGVAANITVPDEGVSTGAVPTNQLSPVSTGYPVDGCGSGCGGTDGPGLDIYSGVTVSGGTVTAGASSSGVNSTAGQQARHDSNANQRNGMSMYLLADGHVKYIKSPAVASGLIGFDGSCLHSDMAARGVSFTYNPS